MSIFKKIEGVDLRPTYEELEAIAEARMHHIQELKEQQAAQPSPTAVELALAEEKANQEQIGATVQAARASATQPQQQIPLSEWAAMSEAEQEQWSKDNAIQQEIDDAAQREAFLLGFKIGERKRDVLLQAQRDELLAACQDLLMHGSFIRNGDAANAAAMRATVAIARATKGGTGQ